MSGFFKGVTLCQTLSSWRFRHGIFYVVCLKMAYKGGGRGGGHGHPRTPPRYALKLEVTEESEFMLRLSAVFFSRVYIRFYFNSVFKVQYQSFLRISCFLRNLGLSQ